MMDRNEASIRARSRTHRCELLALLVMVAGCAAGQAASSSPDPRHSFDLLQLEPGALAITSSPEPAGFGFEASLGRVESASEGAGRAARTMLTTPNLLHPQVEAAVGAVEFVLTPFAAGYGALSARHRVLPEDKLAEANGELTQAMRSMAGQERLREQLLQCAGEKTRRGLLLVEPSAAPAEFSEPVSAYVETTVESLRLERSGAAADSRVLLMKARARVVNAATGAVVFDQPYEFRSEKALFIDWARPGGFESVAQTGYRELAERITRDIFVPPAAEPIRLGPAFAAVAHRTGAVSAKAVSRVKFASAALRTSRAHPGFAGNAEIPRARFAVLQIVDNDPLEIYSRGGRSELLIQSPPTREEPNPETITDTEWLLGGLENDRNAVVQALAGFAAVPFGFWEQTFGLLRHRPSEEEELAERDLKLVARRMDTREALASYVAQALVPRTSQTVALFKAPPQFPEADAPVPTPCSNRVTPAGWAHAQAEPASRAPHESGTAVEVFLVETRLARLAGLRARWAVCVDARVTLIRKSDGQEIYTFPITYRSAGKPLRAWAKKDASVFRRELMGCCREMGAAATQELVARGMITPKPELEPVFAQK